MIKLADRTVILVLMALQLAVCLPFITSFPIALDEPFSIFWAQQDLGEMVTYLNKGNNSPLHFVLLHFWEKLFGISAFSVRFLSLIFSIATIPFIYKLARKMLTADFATLAVLLFVFSRFHHYHAMEARMYTLFVFETVVIIWLTYVWIFENKKHAVWLIIAIAAALYTHYIGVILAGFTCLIGLIYLRKSGVKALVLWLVVFGVALVLFIPGLLVFLSRFSDGTGSGWVPEAQYSELYGNIIRFFNNTVSFVVIVLTVLVFFILNKTRDFKRLFSESFSAKPFFLALFFVIPYLGMFVYSKIVSPIFLDRYLLFTTVPLYIFFSLLVANAIGNRLHYWAILIIAGMMIATVRFVPDNNREPDKVAETVQTLYGEDAYILIAPAYYDLTFLYHYDRSLFENVYGQTDFSAKHRVQTIYSFGEFNQADSSIKKLIVVDDNMAFVYPNHHIYEDAETWGIKDFDKEFKGGTRVTSFIKK